MGSKESGRTRGKGWEVRVRRGKMNEGAGKDHRGEEDGEGERRYGLSSMGVGEGGREMKTMGGSGRG